MSRKSELIKAIGDSESEIEALEKKRSRSQPALMNAILNGTQPDPADTEYFRVFSALIDSERENLRNLMKELAELKK